MDREAVEVADFSACGSADKGFSTVDVEVQTVDLAGGASGASSSVCLGNEVGCQTLSSSVDKAIQATELPVFSGKKKKSKPMVPKIWTGCGSGASFRTVSTTLAGRECPFVLSTGDSHSFISGELLKAYGLEDQIFAMADAFPILTADGFKIASFGLVAVELAVGDVTIQHNFRVAFLPYPVAVMGMDLMNEDKGNRIACLWRASHVLMWDDVMVMGKKQ